MSPIVIVLIVLGVFALWLVSLYNGLITSRNRVDEAWSDIDVQLKRRYDLIPNLVETVKGYASHERETLDRVIQARAAAMSTHDNKAATPADIEKSENMLSSTLKSIFALSEAYPDLKANANFSQLQSDLTDTEDKIQAARRFYNGVVRDFNTKLQRFPNNIFAGMFKFSAREFFEVETAEEKQNVKVQF